VGRQAALIALALAGCSAPPFGEVLINVDSEPTVPALIGQLRIDLYTTDLDWFESRDVVTPDPSGWPVSFGVFTDQPGSKTVRVRLRAFPEGAVRDYQGERFAVPMFTEPPSVHSLAELCAQPPDLPQATSRVFRRAAQPVTELIAQNDCKPPTNAGSVAVSVFIPQAGTYHFAVIDDDPGGEQDQLGGDTTLFLRKSCVDPASQVQCNDDVDPANHVLTSAFDATLSAGTYYLISGGKYSSPADLTLRWDESSQFAPVLPPPPTYGPPGQPLSVDGAPTPSDEPQPNLAIDRLIDVEVDYGTLRTASVLLRGECFGTQADLFGGATCIDTAGVRVPVDRAVTEDGITRAAESAQGSWAAERPVDCLGPARPRSAPAAGVELYDEQVCVQGGAFKLGDARVIGLDLDAIPEQLVVLAPFFLDKYEYTVARYRRALDAGFQPPDDSPWVNDGALSSSNTDLTSPISCTYSKAPMGRETLPLTCLSWYTARALCQFEGGDLPSHAEWEYAATAAGRAPGVKTLYPWSDDTPDCNRTIFGRGGLDTTCIASGAGPQPVALEPFADADLSPAGISGLGGNVGEWAIDSLRDYRDPCWFMSPLRGVGCSEREAPDRSARGGAWPVGEFDVRSSLLAGVSAGVGNFLIGFRCAKQGAP
jgi:formylglycine-generating enzyme required for sulfatase activity